MQAAIKLLYFLGVAGTANGSTYLAFQRKDAAVILAVAVGATHALGSVAAILPSRDEHRLGFIVAIKAGVRRRRGICLADDSNAKKQKQHPCIH